MNNNEYLWVEALNKALKSNKKEAFSRYFQLATVNAERLPKVRTVVFRGMNNDGCSPLIISDTRSAKTEQITQCSSVELCWYFPFSREQFRIMGHATIYSADTTVDAHSACRARVWQQLSHQAKAQFFWPAPGSDRVDALPEEQVDVMPKTFQVISIRPSDVDHLILSNPQRRLVSRFAEEQWHVNAVNP